MSGGERVNIETRKSPLCIYQPHCGSRVELGAPVIREAVNRSLRCLTCGATGVLSESLVRAARQSTRRQRDLFSDETGV